MKNGNLKADDVYKILKKFVEEEVDGGDFDQGLDSTLIVLKTWWNKNKHKFIDSGFSDFNAEE